MKVVIAGTNTAKLVIYPIAPGPIPGSKLTNWVICMLADKRARARAKERGVTREGLSVFVSGAAQTTRTSPTRRARGPPADPHVSRWRGMDRGMNHGRSRQSTADAGDMKKAQVEHHSTAEST